MYSVVVFGKKIVRRRVGYLRTRCSVCQQVAVQKVMDVRLAGHAYFIAMSKGLLVRRELWCNACRAVTAHDPSAFLKTAANPNEAPVAPSLATPPAARSQQLSEPFLQLEYLNEIESQRSPWRSVRAVVTLVALIASVPAIAFSPLWLTPPELSLGVFLWTGLFLVSGGSALALTLALPRLLVNRVRGVLRVALKPLAPSRAEIHEVLCRLQREGHFRHLRAEDLVDGNGTALRESTRTSSP